MPNFSVRVWNSERIFMVDFERAPVSSTIPAAQRVHPHRTCPDIDRVGYSDDAAGGEHGPTISARLPRPGENTSVRVTALRTEISTAARLYAVSANPAVARVVWPANGQLSATVKTTLVISPRSAGRTSIDIRYHWPDGPIIGRLYVVVRATRVINVRAHMVTVNGAGQALSFLGRVARAGENAAQHHANRLTEIITGVNHVLEPHGLLVVVNDTVASAWTNALFGAGPSTTTQVMRAMALSPNRSPARINLYLLNSANLPFAIGFVALGPPVAWAIARGAQYPPGNNVGSGIVVDASASPMTGSILAHEFAHVFALSRIVTAAPGVGSALMWHTIGDRSGAGITHGRATRDDIITRRRLMYPWTTLGGSGNAWRSNVGYGANMGAQLVHRRLTQDITFEESRRAYDFATPANIYAP